MARHKRQSLALWQEMLAQGRRIPAVGGSDTHQSDSLRPGTATPATIFMFSRFDGPLCWTPFGRALLLTRTPGDGPVELRVNERDDGRHRRRSAAYDLHFEACGPLCGDEILLISENGLFRKWQASVSRERRTLEVPRALFYRLEVRRPSPRGGQPIAALPTRFTWPGPAE